MGVHILKKTNYRLGLLRLSSFTRNEILKIWTTQTNFPNYAHTESFTYLYTTTNTGYEHQNNNILGMHTDLLSYGIFY